MKNLLAILVSLFAINQSFAADSSALGPIASNSKVYQCYGKSNNSEWSGTQWDSNWYRCDGWENDKNQRNVYVNCPAGYVQKGVYIWNFTTSTGGNISRCRVICQQITTELDVTQCDWKGTA